jgi:hypothetical protein
MAGIYNGPSRGGTRGGKDQFSWDSVKSDQQREFYLGHSVKAATGRWQKGKDIFWYQKEKDPSHTLSNEDAIAQERAMAKQREEALMMEALGLKPKQPGTGTNAVNISRKEHGGGSDRAVRKDDNDDVPKKERKRRRKEKKRKREKEKTQEQKERRSDKHGSKRRRRHRSQSRSIGSISSSSDDEGEYRRRRRKSFKI